MAGNLEDDFRVPPDSARPGVYWYFMDGNQDRDEMVADLEAMTKVGIGTVLFLEVNIGVPTGPVSFMSDPWQDNLIHAIKTTERLGMEFILGTGPGWAGSGGSWVKPEDSMQHLVGSQTTVQGPALFEQELPVPAPHPPNRFAGMNAAHRGARDKWYRDLAVIAFPTPEEEVARFDNFDLKTLKEVRPYSINKRAPAFVMPQADYPEPDEAQVIDAKRVIDLTSKMQPDGTLLWNVPEGDWTIMRFVARGTGQTTRPAPRAGHGFECDKFSADAYRRHWDNFQGRLLKQLGPSTQGKGLTTIHLDSWEMSSQNWSGAFREEFITRRGYDPQPFYPAYMGWVVGSLERTERFLWDMRKTSQELVLEYYAGTIKKIAREHGLRYSNEPYDMNPAGDIDLGSVADIPACEFWNAAGGPDTQYSCIEAVSIAHTMGKPQVNAEAFTTSGMQYLNYPGNMKNQTDWAFAMGINGIIFHTFQHQPLGGGIKPGMTMGPYGVQWHRNRAGWPLFAGYHEYIARCSHLLRQGVAVADILYLTPEGAPHIFQAPQSALTGAPRMRDKRGYNFDAVTPRILEMRAKVENGKITFPGGTRYRLLVLPNVDTMTPEALEAVAELVRAGATVIGNPPRKSPSFMGYPACDERVQELAAGLWGKTPQQERTFGKGRIVRRPDIQPGTAKDALLPKVGNWIWSNKGNPAVAAEAGSARFSITLEIPDAKAVRRAVIAATADNSFTLRVNDRKVLQGDNFNVIYTADVLSALQSGKNTISAIATNGGDAPNPAGFIAALRLEYADGTSKQVGSDGTWQASTDGITWSAAKNLGPGDMPPWGLSVSGGGATPGLYPDYAVTAAVLKGMGIPEDFQSDAAIRYGHRRTDESDIYFVANTADKTVNANCDFRVSQGRPRLWDPVTAQMRELPQFTRPGEITSVPMTFAPHQSFFVIFPRDGSDLETAPQPQGENFPAITALQTLEGSWEVTFDPKWGGPEKVTFDALQDWTAHAERGIKFYSGIATYRKVFSVQSSVLSQSTAEPSGANTDHGSLITDHPRLYLDLGTVHDIAEVTLNGKKLGVVWCAPWRVEITAAVKPGENRLEINVANRWPNRLLGDQQPPDKDVRTLTWDSGLLAGRAYKTGRYTFTTNAGRLSGLLPSGLLGPVRITGE